MNTKSHLRTRMLCEGALMVALAQILGYLKLAEAPNGGSITFAMFPIILFAVRWGLRPGLMAGFLFGLLQLIFDGAYAWGWQSMLLDYLVAFTPLGLAGLFRGKSWGAVCRHAGRLPGPICHPLYQRRHRLQNSSSHGVPELDLFQSGPVFSGL